MAEVDAGYLTDVIAQLGTPYPDNRTINIVCHGHSVPAGYFRTPDVHSFDSYPHLLHVSLKAAYPCAIVNVIVTAMGGEASDSGAARFERDVLRHNPAVVTIDYALNDRRIGLGPAERAWRGMVETAKAAGVKVLLLTPTADCESDSANSEDPLNRHAEFVRGLAQELSVGLVDSWAAFMRHVTNGGSLADLMAQHNHPNRQGHELVAAELARWFRAR